VPEDDTVEPRVVLKGAKQLESQSGSIEGRGEIQIAAGV
jgi:hypothetical protein